MQLLNVEEVVRALVPNPTALPRWIPELVFIYHYDVQPFFACLISLTII